MAFPNIADCQVMTRHQAKLHLKENGYSQRGVASQLGVTYEHLNRCLNGHRSSNRLMKAILSLPEAERHIRRAPGL
jgi:predicted XRE-type DNA-binding protein